MSRPLRSRILDKIGRTDPALSFTQRCWDLASSIWGPLTLAGTWAASVTVSAYIGEWWSRLGPLGVTLLAFATFMAAAIGWSLALFLKAGAVKRRAEASASEHWAQKVDKINPLEREFSKQRLSIADLANPFTRVISNKTFIDCELVGPANIVITATKDGIINFLPQQLHDCDLVPIKRIFPVYNSIEIRDCDIYNGTFYKCTLYLLPNLIRPFADIPGSTFIALTGDQEIDSRPPPSAEAGAQS